MLSLLQLRLPVTFCATRLIPIMFRFPLALPRRADLIKAKRARADAAAAAKRKKALRAAAQEKAKALAIEAGMQGELDEIAAKKAAEQAAIDEAKRKLNAQRLAMGYPVYSSSEEEDSDELDEFVDSDESEDEYVPLAVLQEQERLKRVQEERERLIAMGIDPDAQLIDDVPVDEAGDAEGEVQAFPSEDLPPDSVIDDVAAGGGADGEGADEVKAEGARRQCLFCESDVHNSVLLNSQYCDAFRFVWRRGY